MNKIVLFSVISFSTIVFSGCNFLQKSATDTATQLAGQQVIEQMLKDIEDPLVRQHLAAQFQVRSYRTITDSSGRGQTSTTEVQVEGDSAKFRTIITDQGKVFSDMIVIGDTTYVKDLKDGVWWMQTGKPIQTDDAAQSTAQEAPAPDEFQRDFEEKETGTKYTSLGTETCGSLTCYKYREETEGQEGARTFWFDDQKFLLRRDEFTYGEFTTVNTYEYDNVTVNAPSPTKPVPEGKNIYQYLIGNTGTGFGLPEDFDPSQYQIPEGY